MATAVDDVVTTGDFIAEWMAGEGINAAELARRLGVTRKHVSELLHGKAPLSHQVALGLELVTGVPARLWNLYESGYREALARRMARVELAEQHPQAEGFPLSYLRGTGYITAPDTDPAGTVGQLLDILGVASVAAFEQTWASGSIAYRRAVAGRADAPALAIWLALGERNVTGTAGLAPFDRDRLESLVPILRGLTFSEPAAAMEEAARNLRQAGVVLSFVPAVPDLDVHGATRWRNGHPVVQLCVEWEAEEDLWFALMHELGHVLLHGQTALYITGEPTHVEREADAYATRALIPTELEERLRQAQDPAAVSELAEEAGVAPAILLGGVQRITGDYSWGHRLRRPVEIPMSPPASR